ncbi:circadian clock-controlled protein daywake [Diabrotica virgifera virgifera]|uniref:Circadian clock-controlled protein-like n=1 Tax=Diabrotica virgifera virgifera TaxID=50390 RepID=A0A6P7F1T8_DIAVI|nr:circadian clock-controlled protein daywake [Diabrotica virgifera virgifera]
MFVKVAVLVFCLVCLADGKLPSYFKVCKRSDPNLDKCVTDSVMTLKPQLAKGIPELEIPPLEPFDLDTIVLKSGNAGVRIDANFSKLIATGASGFEVYDIKCDIPKNVFLFKLKIPHLEFNGDYDIDMNVLVLKYKGSGPISGNFTDLDVQVRLKGHIKKIDGKNYQTFEKILILLKVGGSHLKLGNLFLNQKGLGDATNQVVNDNADIFLKEIRPALVDSLSDKFTLIANKVCRMFTYDELFPM